MSKSLVELVESRSIYTGKTWQDIHAKETGILYHAKYKDISAEILYIYKKPYIRVNELSSTIGANKERHGENYKIPNYILSSIRKWDCSEGGHNILCNYSYEGEYESYESEFIDNYVSFVAALYLAYVILGQISIPVEIDIITIAIETYNKRVGLIMSETDLDKDVRSIRKRDENTYQINLYGVKIDFIIINKRIYFRLQDFERLISKSKNGFEDSYKIPRYLCKRIELWAHCEDDVPHLFIPGHIADSINADISYYYKHENEFDEYISYIAALFIGDFLADKEKTLIVTKIMTEVLKIFEEEVDIELEDTGLDFLNKNNETSSVDKLGYDDIPF